MTTERHRLWKVAPMTQLEKLDNLIRAAERCRVAAEHNLIFASRNGVALINAMHDLLLAEQAPLPIAEREQQPVWAPPSLNSIGLAMREQFVGDAAK